MHSDAQPKVTQRLAVATDLARRHGAHLVGLHVQVPFTAPAMFDGTAALDDLFAAYEEMALAKLGPDCAHWLATGEGA